MTVRIFIGCPANNEDLESQSVLEYSIRKYATEEVDITWMKLSTDPKSFWFSDKGRRGWLTRGWATPFSALRWSIPAYCNFEGKAIYLDVDMILKADIAELWNTPFNTGSFVIAKNPSIFCCSLFDCARAKKHLPSLDRIKTEFGLYSRLRKNFGVGQVQSFPPGSNWNCLDGERYPDIDDPAIKLVHCTMIPTQPQMKYALPRLAKKGQKHWSTFIPRQHPRKDIIRLFDTMLQEAIDNGYPPERYETSEIFGDYHREI